MPKRFLPRRRTAIGDATATAAAASIDAPRRQGTALNIGAIPVIADDARAPRTSIRSERGAILIQVALSMVVLTAFSAFVIDYGVMWVGRRQAQNAADAGALAGAIALAFDDDDIRLRPARAARSGGAGRRRPIRCGAAPAGAQ